MIVRTKLGNAGRGRPFLTDYCPRITDHSRPGVILVVVVSLLALFAVIGLGYVIYAESAAAASAISRQTQDLSTRPAELQPELVLNAALARLIYDSYDDETGVYNALRGHSFARSIYGWNPPTIPDPTDPTGIRKINTNIVPFNGTGRIVYREGLNAAGAPFLVNGQFLSGLPWNQIVNYTLFNGTPGVRIPDPIIRDPERYPQDPTVVQNSGPNNQFNYRFNPGLGGSPFPASQQVYFGGYNQPYTYPDLNNVYLGAVRASDGQVLMPSFHRPWLFSQIGPTGAPILGPDSQPLTDYTFLSNPSHVDWYRPSGRLKLLRPRPIDSPTPALRAELSAAGLNYPPREDITPAIAAQYAAAVGRVIAKGGVIPFPTDPGGDVKNLLGSPGGNDSVWLDLGLPVRTTREGKKYKPLVAFLIRDLDGLVNINAAGNVRGTSQVTQVFPGQYTNLAHVSNLGLGRHEINVQKVLNPNSLQIIATEYPNLFQGMTSSGVKGRYVMSGTMWAGNALAIPSVLNPPVSPDPSTVPLDPNSVAFAPLYYPIDVDGARKDMNGTFRSIPTRGFDYSVAMPLTLSSFPDSYSPPPQYGMPGTNVPAYTGSVFGVNPILGTGFDNDVQAERDGHPMLFNPLRKTGYSQLLDAQEMHRLQARYASPLDWQDSVLSKLLPNAMQDRAVRHSITLLSADVARPGLAPQAHLFTGVAMPGVTSNLAIDNTLPAPLNQLPMSTRGEEFPYPFSQKYPRPLPLGTFPLAGSAPTQLPNDFMGDMATYFAPPPMTPANPDIVTGTKQQVVSGAYTNDGRNFAANLRERIDLNRPLRPYPELIPGNTATAALPPAGVKVNPYFNIGNPADLQKMQDADKDRLQFARDIFDGLRKATSAPEITAALAANTPDFLTLQYLAQLAVNIVDDIDEDDVSTVFQWIAPSATIPAANTYVFGVEQPKVVINETYIEQTNGEGLNPPGVWITPPPSPSNPPPRRAIKYRVNVWVELHNTMVPPVNVDVNPVAYSSHRDYHTQSMVRGTPGSEFSAYRLHLFTGDPAKTIPTIGSPAATDSPDMYGAGAKSFDFIGQPVDKTVIFPINTSLTAAGQPSSYTSRDIDTVKNEGFVVIGPQLLSPLNPPAHDLKPSGGMNDLATISTDMLNFDVNANSADTQPWRLAPRIVLQRLANPYMPENPTPGPGFNPYITVDYVDFTLPTSNPPAHVFDSANFKPVGRATTHSSTGPNMGAPPPAKSVARRQPFAGNISRLVNQYLNPAGGTSPPEHSFFRHNGSNKTAPTTPLPDGIMERFDWLVCHNRKLTSPMELLHVAAVAPWELTQKFAYYAKINELDAMGMPMPHDFVVLQGHTAPWLDELNVLDLTVATSPVYKKKSLQDILVPPSNPPAAAPPGQPLPAPVSTRLHRALELFRTGDRTIEMAFGGRDIGKININTIYDQATFDAICDAVSKQYTGTGQQLFDSTLGFTQADVISAWNAMTNGSLNRSARTPDLTSAGTYTQITDRDLPFWSMGAPHSAATAASRQEWIRSGYGTPLPQYVLNSGIESTVLRSIVPPPAGSVFSRTRMFDAESQFASLNGPQVAGDNTTINPLPPVRHPMLEKSLLTKIFEHLTTRSNVFAVYMTVGYFEVKDDTQKPEFLGDEIGVLRDASGGVVENRAVRHRMFAIIDRTNLTLQPPTFNVATGQIETFDPQKREDQLRQGPAPYYYTSQCVQVGNRWRIVVPIASSVPIPTTAIPQPFVQVATGTYNGISWELYPALLPAGPTATSGTPLTTRPATMLYVGTGSDQRRLVVMSVRNLGNGYAEVDLGLPPTTGAIGAFASWLNIGAPPVAPALITNAIAGNPGPQPDFDHKLPNYRGVVLYSVIMD